MHASPQGLSRFGLALAVLLSPVGAARADDYAIDKTASKMTVFVKKDGYLSGMGHDHTIEVKDLGGRIAFDPASPESGRVELTIDAASLAIVDDVDKDEREEIKGNMDKDVLEVKDHRTIRFVSEKVEVQRRDGDRLELQVKGKLTLHGQTRSTSLWVEVAPDKGRLVCTGKTTLLQSEYGIEPYSAFLGAVKVQDKVAIEFSISARPRAARTVGTR